MSRPACVPCASPHAHRPNASAYVSIRQHPSAYVSIRQHTPASVSIRQHTPEALPGGDRQAPTLHFLARRKYSRQLLYFCTSKASKLSTSFLVLITSSSSATEMAERSAAAVGVTAYVSIRQHTSACVSMRQHTSAYVSIRIRQHTSAYVSSAVRSSEVNLCTLVLVKQVN